MQCNKLVTEEDEPACQKLKVHVAVCGCAGSKQGQAYQAASDIRPTNGGADKFVIDSTSPSFWKFAKAATMLNSEHRKR